MILYADPHTVMRFVSDNYELLARLYRVQLKHNLIDRNTFELVTTHKGEVVTRRLFSYRLLQELGDDYRLTEAVGAYLGFLMQEFKPLLPEQLQRYYTSINDIFELLELKRTTTSNGMHLQRLEHLHNEILSFLDNVTNNTFTLLKKTQRLKANRQQLTYAQRLTEARQLIEQYINPLTNIVNLNNKESLAALLNRIGKAINLERMAPHPPSILDRYEQLDQLLRQVNRRLQHEGDTIRRELLPLIDRIKRESEVLGGFLAFLEQPLLSTVPDIGKLHTTSVFGDQTGPDLRMYVEQFLHNRQRQPIRLQTGQTSNRMSVFNQRDYRKKLLTALPLDNFFHWCKGELDAAPPDHEEQWLTKLISLLFADDQLQLAFSANDESLKVGAVRYRFPAIRVTKKATP